MKPVSYAEGVTINSFEELCLCNRDLADKGSHKVLSMKTHVRNISYIPALVFLKGDWFAFYFLITSIVFLLILQVKHMHQKKEVRNCR